ncbi:zinc knuckle CX2CX4HX4C containing protein [Tanacetum coccineum]|uniref:Zinc knuckle CX2CX4HX4C containing protein n=1 Tax=Tanacetum coccineum TaxID=301880 RepID=A0ABQ5EV06_9ASTR
MESRRESIVGEDSIRIVNSFSKVIDEMNKSTTNHAARVDRKPWSDSDSAITVSLNPKSGVTCDGSPKLITDIEAGKHDELLSEMTNDDRMETLDALGTICNSIQANNINADVIPCKVSHVDDSINLNVDESTIPSDPIIQSVDINTKSTSYAGAAGASAKDQPKVNSNISVPKWLESVFEWFVEYLQKNYRVENMLKRIMMNSKGFFFFKFDSRAGLEAVLEGGPWLIRKSPIILKNGSMDTRLLKEELTRIPIRVKLHDVPIQVFKEDGISLIAIRSLVNLEAELVNVVTIGIPSLSEDDFTKETIRVEYEWRPPRCDTCKIFGHVHDYCPKKVITGNSSKKDNLSMSNSFSALNEEEEEDEEEVENVYDDSANLIHNKKAGGSHTSRAAAA